MEACCLGLLGRFLPHLMNVQVEAVTDRHDGGDGVFIAAQGVGTAVCRRSYGTVRHEYTAGTGVVCRTSPVRAARGRSSSRCAGSSATAPHVIWRPSPSRCPASPPGIGAGPRCCAVCWRRWRWPCAVGPVTVPGVDDFSKRRGHSYATILINMDTRRPVDVLDERAVEPLAQWLRAHPGIQVVCRDRAGAYAEGVGRRRSRGDPARRSKKMQTGIGHQVAEPCVSPRCDRSLPPLTLTKLLCFPTLSDIGTNCIRSHDIL